MTEHQPVAQQLSELLAPPARAAGLVPTLQELALGGPNDYRKLPRDAAHDVDEVLVVDPRKHMVHWLALADGEHRPVEHRGLVGLGPAQLAGRIDWPPL